MRTIHADLGDPRELLSNCIDPPDECAVDQAIAELEAIGAIVTTKQTLEEDGWFRGSVTVHKYEITKLGGILAQLPLDLHTGLLVVHGAIFGALYDTMIIAGKHFLNSTLRL